jgi:folate-binding protein YgfZ
MPEALVAAEIPSASKSEIHCLREQGGYGEVAHLGLIKVAGKDAAKFLQFRTTNDAAGLDNGRGVYNAMIDRTAHVEALFTSYRLDDAFYLLIERTYASSVIDHMERFHFSEDVSFAECEGRFEAVQGPRSAAAIGELAPQSSVHLQDEPTMTAATIDGAEVLILRQSITGELGYLIWLNKAATGIAATIAATCKHFGMCAMNADAWETARIEAGIPRYGVEVSAEDLLPDTGLEEYTVSYTKGCYLGQEVIARIKTYSAPRKGLIGLVFPGGFRPAELTPEVGEIKSYTYSSTLGKPIAIAYMPRSHRVPGQTIKVGDTTATVCLLPFYKSAPPAEAAKQLYEQALEDYAADRPQQAISKLRESLLLNPTYTDAYEILGVILSKFGELDEAIRLMKRLAELQPDSVMAHTNLSVFYMEQGNKELAEEEKAISMSITMEKIAREMREQQQQQEQKKKQIEDAKERIEMFKQVLEIDPEDQLANYGIGNLLVDIEQFQEAIPHLRKAVALKPNHTAAYCALGKALQGDKQINEAIEIYNRGIEVAAQRGDMTPLKEMRMHLDSLL